MQGNKAHGAILDVDPINVNELVDSFSFTHWLPWVKKFGDVFGKLNNSVEISLATMNGQVRQKSFTLFPSLLFPYL